MSDDQLPLGAPMGWTPGDPGAEGPGPADEGSGPADAGAGMTPEAVDVPAAAEAPVSGEAPIQATGPVSATDGVPAAGGPSTGPTAVPAGPLGAAPGGAIGVEGWTAASTAPQAKRRFPRGLIIGLVVIAVVVGAGVIGRDFLSGNASDLQVGDCFDDPIAAGGTATEVQDVQHHPCSEPHQFEVFGSFEFPGDKGAAFPGNSGFDTFVSEQCGPAFTAYVGVPETGSSLTWVAYQPLEAGWNKGDREVTCFLQDRALAKLTGSVKGTNR